MTVGAGQAQTTRDLTYQQPSHLARLESLAQELLEHGMRTRLMAPSGRVPSLHVVNPCAASLAEDVYVGRTRDGSWWYWWPWAERIARGDDVAAAAGAIARVLAARDQPF